MKKIFGIFSLVLLGLLFTSCNNNVSFKKYKNEVTKEEFKKALTEKIEQFSQTEEEAKDLVMDLNVYTKNTVATTYEGIDNTLIEFDELDIDYLLKFDADNNVAQLIMEQTGSSKDATDETSLDGKKEIFVQQIEDETYTIDPITKTYEKNSNDVFDFQEDLVDNYFESAIYMLELEGDVLYYKDDNIYTMVAKRLDDDEEYVEMESKVQFIFNEKGIVVLSQSKNFEKTDAEELNLGIIEETTEMNMKIELSLKNVNVKPKDLNDYLSLDSSDGGLL